MYLLRSGDPDHLLIHPLKMNPQGEMVRRVTSIKIIPKDLFFGGSNLPAIQYPVNVISVRLTGKSMMRDRKRGLKDILKPVFDDIRCGGTFSAWCFGKDPVAPAVR